MSMRIFVRQFTVAAADIDIQQHVNNVSYVQWMQDLAVGHSSALGWDLARYERIGQTWVVRSHQVVYRRPALLGESITALTWVASVGRRQSLRRYRFCRSSDGAVLVEAETVWVYVDGKTGRPVSIPENVRADFPVVEEAEIRQLLEQLREHGSVRPA